MRESSIEKYFKRQVKAAGGVAEKFKSPGKKNVPDQIVTWVAPMLDFVELKATDEKPNSGQRRDHERRRKRGYFVMVIDSKELVDIYIEMRGLKCKAS